MIELARHTGQMPSLITPTKDFGSGTANTSLDTHEAVEVFKGGLGRVSDRVVGREGLVEQTALAILSREHQLIFSRAGTAKTLYAQSVFGEFDAETFAIQFTKGTTEEAVVGAYDLEQFKAGRIWHMTEGSMVTAQFAFLDEFMDANDMVLRSILGVLNERKFSKGKQQEDARLHTAIAVTNYLRQSEMSEALLDRFLFKVRLDPKTTTLNEMLIDRVYGRYNGSVVRPEVPVPMDVPINLAGIVRGENPDESITASYSALFLKNQIIKAYVELATEERRKTDAKADELYVSPRTMAKARDVLNASALLNHRSEVTGEDLLALRFVLMTISGSDGQGEHELFLNAVDKVAATYSEDDLGQVERLMTINEYYEAFRSGEVVEAMKRRPNFIQRILEYFRLASWEDVNADTFRTALIGMNIRNSEISQMRHELIEKVDCDV